MCKFDTMKLFKTLLILVVIGATSCQSEYGERMKKALKLKKEYQKVHGSLVQSKDPVLKIQLSEIKKEILYHAAISGNEQLFLQEIWNN